jgi:hypothetical protein
MAYESYNSPGPVSRFDLRKLKIPTEFISGPESAGTTDFSQLLVPDNLRLPESTALPAGSEYSWSSPSVSEGQRSSVWNRLGETFSGEKARKTVDSLLPFASNIINSFRKPPMPRMGTLNPTVTLDKVDFSNERNAVGTTYNAADRAAERSVDSNTAEAIKAFNRGSRFRQINDINARETNTNVGIGNQQAMINAQITAGNTAKMDKYGDELVSRSIAQQREQSANIANAGDKIIAIKNENAKRDTELSKAGILKSLYDRSGVLQRQGIQWKKDGRPDPFGRNYDWLDNTFAMGGKITMKIPTTKVIC